MPEIHSELNANSILLLLLISAVVSITSKWLKLPYSIALVIVGLLIGIYNILPGVAMTPDLILVVLLPALLFEASWNLDLSSLKREKWSIGVFSTLGVLLSTLVVGGVLYISGAMDMPTAFLFGAMISATDPISVIALFRKIGIDKRLTLILEGESLFNDGTAVVLFKLLLAIVLSGKVFSPSHALADFCFVTLGGIVLGLLIGFSTSYITKFFDDHLPEITLTTLAAYGSFLLADNLHVSPVLAVVTAGIVIGNYGSRYYMSATTRIAVNSFWEYAAFVVNSLAFLLIGMQINLELLEKYSSLITIAIAATLIARACVIYGLAPFVSNNKLPLPWKWRHLLFWGGLRGALCMAMALSLPFDYPMREPVIVTTFAVVLFTLLIEGLSLEPLVKLLNMRPSDSQLIRYQDLRSQLLLEKDALKALKVLQSSSQINKKNFDLLLEQVQQKLANIEQQIEDLHIENSSLESLQMQEARRHLLEIRKDKLISLYREGLISEEHLSKVKLTLDHELEILQNETISSH